ncbi:MAG TPA: hypothetical protein VFX61_04470 [Micromonosporaceae bacterium]|nr:hypothetical protein [Micromonosporaceae bacterium]
MTFRRQFERRDRGDRIEVLVDPGPPAAVWLPTRLFWPQFGKVVVGVIGLLLALGAALELVGH